MLPQFPFPIKHQKPEVLSYEIPKNRPDQK